MHRPKEKGSNKITNTRLVTEKSLIDCTFNKDNLRNHSLIQITAIKMSNKDIFSYGDDSDQNINSL